MANGVELLVGSVEIPGEAENFAKKDPTTQVGRVISHLLDLRGEGFVEFTLVKQVVGVH